MSTAQNIRIAAPAYIDQVEVVAYPQGYAPITLNPLLQEVSWTEGADKASVEAQFTLEGTGDVGKIVPPGTWIHMRVWDALRGGWDPEKRVFYVWERGLTDHNSNSTTVVGLDVASFLSRVGARTWVFKKNSSHKKGWTASQIARAILDEFEIPGNIMPTEYQIPFIRIKATPLEMIIAAYSEDRAKTKRKYRIRARGSAIHITGLVPQEKTWIISDDSNIRSAVWTESLDGVASVVRATSIGDNGIPRQATRVESLTNLERFGRIIETIQYDQSVTSSPKRLKELATKRLEKVKKTKRTVEITAEGVPSLRAGDALLVIDKGTGIKGKLFVENLTHNISPGEHLTTLSLGYTVVVPARKPTEEELTLETQPKPDLITFGPDGRPVLNGEAFTGSPQQGTGTGAGTGAGGETGSPVTSVRGQELVRRLNAFIHRDAPMAGMGEMLVRVGNAYGVSPIFLAVLAGYESQFGKMSGRYVNNAYGWGVHLGPSVYTSASWEEGTVKVARGLSDPNHVYRRKGLTTIQQIMFEYAPPSENDTVRYIRTISDWTRQLGGNPQSSVFGPVGSWA